MQYYRAFQAVVIISFFYWVNSFQALIYCMCSLNMHCPIKLTTVVILLKATKHAEREQINKSHWLNNVSRAHFIGRELFPKHHFLVF